MDSTTLPKIIGSTPIPQPKTQPRRASKGKRGPGRFYLHGGARSEFARRVIQSLQPGQAVELEFVDADERFHYQLVLVNVARFELARPVRTRSRYERRLIVWLREEQLRLL